jgi:hypothetical protein
MRKRSRKMLERQEEGAAGSAPPGKSRVDFVMERFGNIEEAGRSFDIEYWQRQGDAAIFRAAWELVEFYRREQGIEPDELRLQRSFECPNPSQRGVMT